jgi:peptide/nickel transport system substrate-binding protein
MMRFSRRLLVLLVVLNLFVSLNHGLAQGAQALTVGTVESIPSLDPADAADVFSWEVLTHLYTGLTRQVAGSLRYELALAASHTVSADGLTHTFTIRPDATFDDGTPITARTFADSINRDFTKRASALVTPYVKAATVGGDGALVLTLTAPIPYLEQLLALPAYFPVHPAALDGANFDHAPTNGVYKLHSRDVNSITLVADPAWKGSPPATGTITIRHFDRPADLRESLKAHEIDIAWRGLPPDDAENATQVRGIRLVAAPGLQTFYLVIGQQEAPYNDPVVRRGMLYLLDREQAVHVSLRDTAVPLYGLPPPELGGSATYPGFDVDQAGAVLAEGGYSQYRRIESEFQVSRAMYGELVLDAADLLNHTLTRQDAFRIALSDTEPRTFLDQIERGTFRLMLIGWTPVVPHPDAYLRPLLHSKGQIASGAHYANPEIDRLLDKAALSGDAPEQAALYNQAQAIALRDVVVVPLWQNRQVLLAWDSVGGVLIEPNFLLRYDRLSVK